MATPAQIAEKTLRELYVAQQLTIAQISTRIGQYESGRPDYVAPVVATPVASSARQNRY